MAAGNRRERDGSEREIHHAKGPDERAGSSRDANNPQGAKGRRIRRADDESPVAEGAERALDHLGELYEVSKLLTRFESLERAVPAVMSRMARPIGLR